jgi:transposase InsO family protein
MIVLGAVRNQTALETATALLDGVISVYGSPVKIISDRGTAFTSGLFRALVQLLNVTALRTTAYHPQANPVERYHQPLMKALRAGVAHEWPQRLSVTQLVLNSAMLKQTGF